MNKSSSSCTFVSLVTCLLSHPCFLSHSNTAEVKAAIQGERGGQEAKVTESSQGGEDHTVATTPNSSLQLLSSCVTELHLIVLSEISAGSDLHK